jgi:hypothetical protein
MVSGPSDNTLHIWDTKFGLSIMESLTGHIGSVTSVAVSPDGRWKYGKSPNENVLKVCVLLLVLEFIPVAYGLPIEPSENVSGIVKPTHAYQAVALGAFGIITACHRSLMAEGFVNARRWGTDTYIGFGLCFVALVWTGVVVVSGFLEDTKPCQVNVMSCAGRLIYAPHMLNATAGLWVLYLVSVKFNLSLWIPQPQSSRDSWSHAFRYHIVPCVNIALGCAVAFVAAGATKSNDYTAAVMCMVGYVVYVTRAGGATLYNDVSVPFKNYNCVRVVLNTSHKAGTLYMSGNPGMDMQAVWSYVWPNQINTVNTTLLPLLRKLEAGQFDLSELRKVLRNAAFEVVLNTKMDEQHLEALAHWLLHCETPCDLDGPVQEIGRELFYYLYVAEQLLFEQRERLPPILREKLCKWRLSSRSGANDIGNAPAYGQGGGLDGLQEVLINVAMIFGKKANLGILKSKAATSILPGYDALSQESYAAKLWSYCLHGTESIFAAMYIFCAVWFADLGAGAGLEPFPIKASDQLGDVIMHQIMWRQAWHSAVISQFTASAVAVIGAIIGGLLG